MKDTSLTQFVRDRDGQPRGLVVATVINDEICYGWSYTNTKAGDRFNKQRAYAIAFGRAETGWGPNVNVPHNVYKSLVKMVNRAEKYYNKRNVSDISIVTK